MLELEDINVSDMPLHSYFVSATVCFYSSSVCVCVYARQAIWKVLQSATFLKLLKSEWQHFQADKLRDTQVQTYIQQRPFLKWYDMVWDH